MARSGFGGLNFLDHDRVDAGTVVRWQVGVSAAGLLKVDVLRDLLARDYPWTHVETSTARIGLPGQIPSERDEIERILRGADIVYDATAEIGVQQVLSDEARERNLPYVCVSATHGGWGGMVARFNHRSDSGCWWCFQAALDNSIPMPATDLSPGVQPPGCNRLTYAGANFDLKWHSKASG